MVDPHRGDLRPHARTGSPARLPLPLLAHRTPQALRKRPTQVLCVLGPASTASLSTNPGGSGGHTRLQLELALTPSGKD